ncbi:MAG TPA: sigma-70 family RNA polymerase sigma factor [Thermomicrobiales bacterium]|jgi:RNA polymerase sigma-70 factor (ECF subfamily)
MHTPATAQHDNAALATRHALDGLFRRNYGQLVATLTRIFGPRHLDLVEDIVQETLLKALGQWAYHGLPTNPTGWLYRVARNGALDALRRERTLSGKIDLLASQLTDAFPDTATPRHPDDPEGRDDRLRDDQLRLIFGCCHPDLSREAQIALTLKTLLGFGVPEIARAFLVPAPTIAQRLVRAKRTIRERDLAFTIPVAAALPARLDAVLAVLYLLFNEGYTAHSGPALTRQDLCADAIRLCSILAAAPVGDTPRVHALLALFLLQASRLPARTDEGGALLTLTEQDRARWDRRLIVAGLRSLRRAAAGDALTTYHLQAEIAACHALAPTHAATDWRRILVAYDTLAHLDHSPLILLNRAVALAEVAGAEAALDEVARLLRAPTLARYPLAHATHADLHRRRGDLPAAHAAYGVALTLTTNPTERRFLERQLRAVAPDAGGTSTRPCEGRQTETAAGRQ